MKIKIFCDIADYKTIKFFNNKPIVDGFTNNPSLMRLAEAKNYKNYSLKILSFCKKKPISFEVFADNPKEMLKQAYKINAWGKNVYVKIPVVNSKGLFMGSVIKELSKKGIKLNINADLTAGFIASEINSRKLLMLTDVKGVIDKNQKLIPELKLKDINKLISNKVIYGGMIPKVKTCIEAVKKGVRVSVILDGRVKNAVLKELLSDKGIGTLFRK